MQKTARLGEDISARQKEAMIIVQDWVRKQKTPIPKKELFKQLINRDLSRTTIEQVIKSLLDNGYIGRAVTISNKTFYKQLRTV